jgi:hypothetical protein
MELMFHNLEAAGPCEVEFSLDVMFLSLITAFSHATLSSELTGISDSRLYLFWQLVHFSPFPFLLYHLPRVPN